MEKEELDVKCVLVHLRADRGLGILDHCNILGTFHEGSPKGTPEDPLHFTLCLFLQLEVVIHNQ